jgi:hypothetical protein
MDGPKQQQSMARVQAHYHDSKPLQPIGQLGGTVLPTFDVNPNYNYSSQFYNQYVGLSESNELHEERKRKIAGNNDGNMTF